MQPAIRSNSQKTYH